MSLGSVWSVGGVAPSLSVGVPNGRGGLIGSGTNAPLYTTSFSNAIPKSQEEREKHEGRLAQALEFDRAQRVFDYTDSSIKPRHVSSKQRKHSEIDSKTTWNGTEWVLDGSQASKFSGIH